MQQDVQRSPRPQVMDPPVRSRRSAFIAFAIVAILLAALTVFQLMIKPAMIKSFLAKAAPPPTTISTDVARTENWVPKLPSTGSVTAFQGIDVTAQITGIVATIGFESGQDVAAGAKLVTLDSAVEQADLAANKAMLQQAELDLSRQNDLSQRAYASQATQQAAQAKRDSAAATVQKSAAVIAQKSIVAPFAGRLGIRKVEIGQYIAPGTLMVTLQALDPIRVDFPVPEQEFAKLKIGQSVEVLVDAFPGQVFSGQIQALDARASVDTRSLLVRAQLPNPNKKLLPGMFANVSILQDAATPRVTVPRTAITYTLFGDSVFVVTKGPGGATTSGEPAPDIVERRFVRVGESRNDRVSVVEGVADGDQVVTAGQLKLQNGARVKIDNATPLTPAVVRPKL